MIRLPLCSCKAASTFESGIAGLCSVISDARVADSAASCSSRWRMRSQAIPDLRGGVFGRLGQQRQGLGTLSDELFLGRFPLGQRSGIQLSDQDANFHLQRVLVAGRGLADQA